MRLVDQTAFRIVTVILAMLVVACGKDNGKGPDTGPEQPVIERLVLSGGAPFTETRDIVVAVICAGNAVPDEILVSEDPSFGGALWIEYHQSGVSHQLSAGDGPKAIYVQVRDAGDRVSGTATAEIVLAEEMSLVGLRPVPAGKSGTSDSSQPRVFELWVANANALYSGQFKLSYDPNRIEATQVDADFTGHILRSTGASVAVLEARFNNDTGTVRVASAGLMSGFTGVNGSGPFARITFAPVETLSTGEAIVFEHESTTGLYVYQDGDAVPLEGVYYVDGELQP